jgi:hypothetical protein
MVLELLSAIVQIKYKTTNIKANSSDNVQSLFKSLGNKNALIVLKTHPVLESVPRVQIDITIGEFILILQ